MKPDWKDAPEWAQWLAQDECGDWWWFQHRPVCGETTWWPSSCAGEWMAVEDAPPNWRDTLEQRPTDRRDIISPDERAASPRLSRRHGAAVMRRPIPHDFAPDCRRRDARRATWATLGGLAFLLLFAVAEPLAELLTT